MELQNLSKTCPNYAQTTLSAGSPGYSVAAWKQPRSSIGLTGSSTNARLGLFRFWADRLTCSRLRIFRFHLGVECSGGKRRPVVKPEFRLGASGDLFADGEMDS